MKPKLGAMVTYEGPLSSEMEKTLDAIAGHRSDNGGGTLAGGPSNFLFWRCKNKPATLDLIRKFRSAGYTAVVMRF